MAPLALLLSLLAAAPQCSAGKTQVRGITATLEAGEKLAQKGRYADAERAFAMVLQHKPDNVRGLLNLGTLLPELGRQAEGLSALERLVTIAPGNPSGLFSLGRLQAMTERHASAVVSLRRASALLDVASSPAPDLSVSVLQGLGASLLHLGRYTEALDASDSFNAVLPLPPRALSNRASALLHLGRGDEALEGWAAAIAADRKDLSLLVLRAAALRQLGRGKEACEDLLIVLRELLEPNVAAAGQPAANAAAALGSTLADLFDDAVSRCRSGRRRTKPQEQPTRCRCGGKPWSCCRLPPPRLCVGPFRERQLIRIQPSMTAPSDGCGTQRGRAMRQRWHRFAPPWRRDASFRSTTQSTPTWRMHCAPSCSLPRR